MLTSEHDLMKRLLQPSVFKIDASVGPLAFCGRGSQRIFINFHKIKFNTSF